MKISAIATAVLGLAVLGSGVVDARPITVKPAQKVTRIEAGITRTLETNPNLRGVLTAVRARNAAGSFNARTAAEGAVALRAIAKDLNLKADIIAQLPTEAQINEAANRSIEFISNGQSEGAVVSDLGLLDAAMGDCDLSTAVAPSSIVAASGNAISAAEQEVAQTSVAEVADVLEFYGIKSPIASSIPAMVETAQVEGEVSSLVQGIGIATDLADDAVAALAAEAMADGVIDSKEQEKIAACWFKTGLAAKLGQTMAPEAASAQAFQIGAACSVETQGVQRSEAELRSICG